ncbi:hypothetical protein L2E82_29021 [Cichorium intybus]|uniref:Uncharacterized protein n=1 Tax=Cichorium intybus TaxID=13427 RepID=A0ACB9CX61_CICIN|nr:hypothetical protein L2E82_29021 [Cichorium intybus]
MTSQYKNPRLLILGGALIQRSHNQLASIKTLLQQENQISLFEDLIHRSQSLTILVMFLGPLGSIWEISWGRLSQKTWQQVYMNFPFFMLAIDMDVTSKTSMPDETMHFVLETLQAVVKEEPVISPIILNMWALHVSDPSMSIDVLDVLEAIQDAPGCVDPLVTRVLPYMGPILNKPQQQPDGLFAGSLDLLTMLLKASYRIY